MHMPHKVILYATTDIHITLRYTVFVLILEMNDLISSSHLSDIGRQRDMFLDSQ